LNEFWAAFRAEAQLASDREPALAAFLTRSILRHASFPAALAGYLSSKIAGSELSEDALAADVIAVYQSAPQLAEAAVIDLRASRERNPAYVDYLTPFLYFKGFQSLQLHRVGHVLWGNGRRELATYLQSRVSEIFQVDIHPAARFGVGVFIDHATGIVVGETATVGDNVSILQDVTLGGTGKESGDRHPKVGDGVLLAAGAKVLGNITIGEGAKIGAGSVVLKPVPPHTTVAGIPATIVGRSINMPALTMDQEFAVDFQI
jgi:serine O-acetyltransferase